jgi:hypothetical protein
MQTMIGPSDPEAWRQRDAQVRETPPSGTASLRFAACGSRLSGEGILIDTVQILPQDFLYP